MPKIIHPDCSPECTHDRVPDLGGVIITRAGERAEGESRLREHFPGKRIDYLGTTAEHTLHAWRVGGRQWKRLPSFDVAPEGKQTKATSIIYRPEVWTGTGQPLPPVPYGRTPPPAPEPFPLPEHTSNQPHPQAIPQPVVSLNLLALMAGWGVLLTHSRGHVPHATTGRPLRGAKELWALRMSRGDQRAVAVRQGDKWASLWTWSSTTFFQRYGTLEAFQGALK